MTTPRPPEPPPEPPDEPPPEPPDDGRDPRVAAWLAVEPLDDVTRARLVRTSLEAAAQPPERRAPRRWLGVAAAALVGVLAVGTVLVARSSDDDTAPTAARSHADQKTEAMREHGAAQSSPNAAAPTGGAADQGASEQPLTALEDLGDIGDVSSPADLRKALTHWQARRAGVPTTKVECQEEMLRLGAVVARAAASVDGSPAAAYVVEQPDGSYRAVTVLDSSCTRGPSVALRP